MKIIHRVALAATDAQRHELDVRGVKYEVLRDDLILFLVDEGDSAWPSIASLIAKWNAPDLVMTEFTRKELARAKSLVMCPSWHHGYPQPERDFGYRRITYDAREFCVSCGTGAVQSTPFRMAREPKWGSRQILQLNWVMDEYFVTPDAWQTVFKPLGIDVLPVLHHRTGEPLKTVFQLAISAWTIGDIDPDGYLVKCCPKCERITLSGNRSGQFPYVSIPSNAHMARTREYFGNDGVAWHTVLVSAQLYQAISDNKLKGAEFRVVAEQR